MTLQRPLMRAAGTHQDYSSTNFELLGLLLLRYANVSAWDQLDQRRAAFPSAALQARFSQTSFALHGPCEEHTRVRGYEPDDRYGLNVDTDCMLMTSLIACRYEPDDRYGLNVDTAFLSCTNGFTCGNVVAPAREVRGARCEER